MAWRLTCPRGQVRCIYTTSGVTGQTGLTDRSDRSLPRNDLHPDSYTRNARRGKTGKGTRSHPTAEFLCSTRSLLRDAATLMKIRSAVLEGPRNPGSVAGFEKTAKTPRAGRFPPPRRSPGRCSHLVLLTALDAARGPSPPRLPRGPRRRRHPFLCQSRDRRPCLHDLASSTAVR